MDYSKIIRLLQSVDSENWNIALNILEIETQKVEIVGLALCFIHSNASASYWTEHAPISKQRLDDVFNCNNIANTITFRELFVLANNNVTSQATLDLLSYYYELYLTRLCVGNGIKSITIKITTNE